MKAWMETQLDDLDLLAIQIDGIHSDEDMLLVAAIGIDANGDKHLLGLARRDRKRHAISSAVSKGTGAAFPDRRGSTVELVAKLEVLRERPVSPFTLPQHTSTISITYACKC